MSRLQHLSKRQLWVNLFFIGVVFISVLLNQVIVKADLISAAKQSYILTFIVANSNQTFNDVAPLLLIVLFVKDIVLALIISISVLIYMLLQRFVVKRTYGYVKIILMITILIFLYAVVILNLYFLSNIGIYSPILIAESCLFLLFLLLQTFLFIQFLRQYTLYRKENNIPFISRWALLNFAYTTIKNTFIISTVLMVVAALSIVVVSKVSMYLIGQLALENYFSQIYQFDMMQLFQNMPPLMQKMLLQIKANDLFYSVQNGVVIIDVQSIDYRIQTKLIELIRTHSIMLIDLLIKVIFASSILFVSNRIYRNKEYSKFVLLVIMICTMGLKMLFIQNTFILFVVCDAFYWGAITIYVINMIDVVFYDGELAGRILLVVRKGLGQDGVVFSKSAKVYQKGKALIQEQRRDVKWNSRVKREKPAVKKKIKRVRKKPVKHVHGARRKRRTRV